MASVGLVASSPFQFAEGSPDSKVKEDARIEELRKKCLTQMVLDLSPRTYLKISLAVAGSVAIATGAVLTATVFFTALSATTFLSIAFVAITVGGVQLVIAKRILLVDSPEQLEEYRREALFEYQKLVELEKISGDEGLVAVGTLLQSLLKRYGAEAIFHWWVIKPSKFLEILAFQLEYMDLPSAVDLMEQIHRAHAKVKENHLSDFAEYPIPGMEILHQIWISETLTMPIDQLFRNTQKYDLDRLEKHKIIHPEEAKLLKSLKTKFLSYKEQFDRKTNHALTKFEKLLGPHKKKESQKLAAAEYAYLYAPSRLELQDTNAEEAQATSNLTASLEKKLAPLKRELESIESNLSGLRAPTTDMIDYWEREKVELQNAIAKVRESYADFFLDIEKRYKPKKARLQAKVEQEKEKLEKTKESIHREYRRAAAIIEKRKQHELGGKLGAYKDFVLSLQLEWERNFVSFRKARMDFHSQSG